MTAAQEPRRGRLEGQVALVTGAARGQGRSHAVHLAREGADIIAIDIDRQIPGLRYKTATQGDLAETIRQVEALGRQVIAGVVDVRDAPRMLEVVRAAVAELGRLDIVVANAGVAYTDPAHLMSSEMWSTVIDINLTGVWNTCNASIPHLIEGGRGGSIIITSSVLGLSGNNNTTAYAASKHGVVGLMKVLAGELGPHRIRVNTLHPSQVNTPMIMHEGMFRVFAPELENPTKDDFAERSLNMHQMPVPWSEPSDISEAVLFLCCDSGRYITGVTLPIDVGLLSR
ncbi:mycofactocin-coupled SDR family oxidoreductase [Rhodococcus sp. T2V]|uniref:mycofactocin-coupled SDR family oxidoreductase n=1 Tax=Rhodococcus sp. T2V TaxID=3034164 RepID=UPI0023E34EDB|nr:mycofactocin-coupled SDR family oxidoreductase [Rhodococcus sp. T2V]MDF3311885.1 mycofactocin-coupled SDR family oxidoreductase [Rhodococcus sp. T2V]